MGGKQLDGIKSMYVNILACVGVKGGESECFRISSGVRQGVYDVPLALQCIYGWSDEGGENEDGEEGSEISGGGKRMEVAWPLVCK